MAELLVGLLSGLLTILFARLIKGERWVYSSSLLVLPGLYASFALYAGERATALQELVVGLPYILAALLFSFVSLRRSALVVGGLWLLHGVFDLTRSQFLSNGGIPDWYPVFCASVDIVVGGYLLWRSRRLRDSNLALA